MFQCIQYQPFKGMRWLVFQISEHQCTPWKFGSGLIRCNKFMFVHPMSWCIFSSWAAAFHQYILGGLVVSFIIRMMMTLKILCSGTSSTTTTYSISYLILPNLSMVITHNHASCWVLFDSTIQLIMNQNTNSTMS